MSVNILDLIILIPLLLWARQGYNRGFVVSLASFAALILGLYFAFFFSDFTANKLTDHFKIDTEYLAVISFIVTFVLVVIAVVLVGNILQKFVDALMLGFLNKSVGAIFGLLKGALYLSILILVINYFSLGEMLIKQKYRDGSMLYQPVESVAPLLFSRLELDNLSIDWPSKEDILDEVY